MRIVFDCWIETIYQEARVFTARLNRGNKQYYADFSFDEVRHDERQFIELGHLFTWFVTDDSSVITMSQLEPWTEAEIEAIKRRAKKLYKKLKEG